MAVLDSRGVIVSVNGVWKQITDAGGLRLKNYGIGGSYFDSWPVNLGDAAKRQLRSLLQGAAPVLTWLYPCQMPDGLKWFLLLALPMSRNEARGAVVWHLNVTPLFPAGFDRASLAAQSLERDVPMDSIVEAVTGAVIDALKKMPFAAATTNRPGAAGTPDAIARLTARQQEVFKCLGDGLTNLEIAEALGASENTVRIHVSAILKRLALKTRLQAAVMAAKLFR